MVVDFPGPNHWLLKGYVNLSDKDFNIIKAPEIMSDIVV